MIKYNRIVEKLAKKHNVIVNDLYNPSIKIHAELGLGTDNVHYSTEGYKKLSNYVTHGLENAMSLEN